MSDDKLKNNVVRAFAEIDKNRAFHGAIPGHFVQYGNLAESRIELFEQKIKAIIKA